MAEHSAYPASEDGVGMHTHTQLHQGVVWKEEGNAGSMTIFRYLESKRVRVTRAVRSKEYVSSSSCLGARVRALLLTQRCTQGLSLVALQAGRPASIGSS
jgi:hypothetical protein